MLKRSDDCYRLNTNLIIDNKELSIYEKAILHLINRKLFGGIRKKTIDKISHSQFIDFCGVKKDTVIRTIKKLEDKKMIIVKRDCRKCINKYKLNYNLFYSRPQRQKKSFKVAHSDTHYIIERSNNNREKKDIERFSMLLIELNSQIVNKKAYKKKIEENIYNKDKLTLDNYKLWVQFNKPNKEDIVNNFDKYKVFLETLGG